MRDFLFSAEVQRCNTFILMRLLWSRFTGYTLEMWAGFVWKAVFPLFLLFPPPFVSILLSINVEYYG